MIFTMISILIALIFQGLKMRTLATIFLCIALLIGVVILGIEIPEPTGVKL